jgi:hypothetical protein
MNWNRILSALVGIIYGVIAFLGGGALALLQTICILIFPMGFIWYADEIGSYTGGTGSGLITNPTPAWMIRIFGWIFCYHPLVL